MASSTNDLQGQDLGKNSMPPTPKKNKNKKGRNKIIDQAKMHMLAMEAIYLSGDEVILNIKVEWSVRKTFAKTVGLTGLVFLIHWLGNLP